MFSLFISSVFKKYNILYFFRVPIMTDHTHVIDNIDFLLAEVKSKLRQRIEGDQLKWSQLDDQNNHLQHQDQSHHSF